MPAPRLLEGEINIASGRQELTTEKRSGKASTIFSVLLPMDPVEPRMAMCFMDGNVYGIPQAAVTGTC